MKPILEVQNLSKRYKISHLPKAYLSLREQMLTAFRTSGNSSEEFWALKDVTFEINPGDSVGIVGRNGAGKSTLLKILSKITPPTNGKIISRGRVASLLEVGTGFHPELTGRENIYFNGSLLGMRRKEIRKKFDEIVDFSGVERFLDTPLKHYSSGMQLRLAFAVAAFLEPEILLLDEVLAVGDAEFQKKCLGKMENISKSGRTILFVSHNMQAISNLCTKGIYISDGRIDTHGSVGQAIDAYLKTGRVSPSRNTLLSQVQSIKPDKDFRLLSVSLHQDSTEIFGSAVNGKELEIRVDYELFNRINGFRVFLDVCDQFGTIVFRSFHDESNAVTFQPGRHSSRLKLPSNFLAPIPYDFKLQFGIHNIRMMEPAEGFVFGINIEHSGTYNKAYHGQHTAGLICPVFPWTIQHG
ncbi:MAG: ABC transporter ATP-binding protein [Cyclobacteriaceae bacterium]|nr:ABC transporter ATP-binding protein [Cyclobacteriaceae bacterium]MDH4298460.1 ABC transporter ATP-binding protein [Cyclobacteriaceae bacterium]MDH5248131.1 ABC transporter ATP-binding protein [Cyclobacteriaceae bacterium]